MLVAQYIEFRRSLGMRFQAEAAILRSFCKAVNAVDIVDVDRQSVQMFLDGNGPVTTYWFSKYYALNAFYRFAIGRGHVALSPLPRVLPGKPKDFEPYIYTQGEIRRLLAATTEFDYQDNFLRAAAFRTLILLLYGAGLRISEALDLKLKDVDLSFELLTIRETKFYKTRLVPISPQLTTTLQAFTEDRLRLAPPSSHGARLLVTCTQPALRCDYARRIFRRIRTVAGVGRRDGARYQPRLHDLRHTFAVHRLISWYREGADVQRLLPQLSTYLGHIQIASTQRYLTMTSELLQEAGHRFELYALKEAHHAQQ
ncbi:MAG: tyrosine-type recombinase/integrase [Candidatus Eisenbacteria bacterium]|nr:tyrosine-type recombinase/integrase [Candidatus Eisenbacteria bacterium]